LNLNYQNRKLAYIAKGKVRISISEKKVKKKAHSITTQKSKVFGIFDDKK